MRLLRHDLRLVAGDYHLQRVASDDKGLRPHQRVAIVVDSAESLATNFNDAVAIVVDSAESLATNFNDAVAIVVDSAESLATNFNDARLSSRPAESSSSLRRLRRPRFVRRRLRRPRFVRRRLRRPRFVRTTQTATIRQETTSRIAFWTLPIAYLHDLESRHRRSLRRLRRPRFVRRRLRRPRFVRRRLVG